MAKDKLTIGGKTFEVSKLDISHNDIWSQNSGRTKAGTYTGDLIGFKWRLDVEIDPCSRETLQKLYTVVESPVITVGFTNPKNNQHKEIKCYSSATKFSVYNYEVTNELTYQGVSFSVVER